MTVYLDEKTNNLIKQLLVYNKPVSIAQIAKDLGYSRRVVYYHLDKINYELSTQKIETICNEKNRGILICDNQKKRLKKILSTHKVMYVFNSEERVLYLMFYITMAKERITLEKMMTLTNTSRNTVLNDLLQIKKYLSYSSYEVKLVVTKMRGYYFEGSVAQFITFLYALLNQIFQSRNDIFLQQIKQLLLDHEDSKTLVSKAFSKATYQLLQQYTQQLSKTFVESDLIHAIKLFPYFILAMRTTPYLKIDNQLQEVFNRLEYPIAANVMKDLSQMFHIQFSMPDIYFLTLMLLSVRKESDGHIDSPVYKKLNEDLMVFIENFEWQAQIKLENKDEICRRLLIHFKALLYRKKYNIFTLNPLTNEIKQDYEDLFQIISSGAKLLEHSLDIQLSDEDLAYIAIHFGGILRHQKKTLSVDKIVILSEDGHSVQKLLVEQCQKYLSRVKIVDMISRIDDMNWKKQVDFIVTTKHDLILPKEMKLDVIIVNPIFQFGDILNLLKRSRNHSIEQSNLTEKLNELLIQYVPNKIERKELGKALIALFDEIISQ